jgi:hypothetical protein
MNNHVVICSVEKGSRAVCTSNRNGEDAHLDRRTEVTVEQGESHKPSYRVSSTIDKPR